MAQQDVRFYLNGLLIETSPNLITAVGTDGHRLAKSVAKIDKSKLPDSSFIVPRKAIQEAQRIVEVGGDAKITFTDNQATFDFNKVKLITKLIDGSFPDYGRVIPPKTTTNILIKAENIKPALQRVSILANEKFKGVRIDLDDKQLTVSSENPEQEKAKETINIDSTGETLSVGFNVSYLIDAISACEGELVNIGLNDENSSALITDPTDPESKFVVMPMRL
jgi:DNA polymerase-3 subunit beta